MCHDSDVEHIGSYCASVWKWLRGSPAVGKNLALLIQRPLVLGV